MLHTKFSGLVASEEKSFEVVSGDGGGGGGGGCGSPAYPISSPSEPLAQVRLT